LASTSSDSSDSPDCGLASSDIALSDMQTVPTNRRAGNTTSTSIGTPSAPILIDWIFTSNTAWAR